MRQQIILEMKVKELIDEVIFKFIKENNNINLPMSNSMPLAPTKPKATIVKFETETETPFTVKFSERGFAIDGTRLSFETLHNALSKGYHITLNGGQGLELTSVRMQKILKYENKY